MKVSEVIAALSTMDPDVQVAFFTRFTPRDREEEPEVVVQIVQCDLPHHPWGDPYGKAPRPPKKIVRVAVLNPSFKALDHAVKEKK